MSAMSFLLPAWDLRDHNAATHSFNFDREGITDIINLPVDLCNLVGEDAVIVVNLVIHPGDGVLQLIDGLEDGGSAIESRQALAVSDLISDTLKEVRHNVEVGNRHGRLNVCVGHGAVGLTAGWMAVVGEK